MINATIVLEGGATRGVFTSGVLDYLMEQDTYLSHVIGVSAGACNARGLRVKTDWAYTKLYDRGR